ncbi:MAG: MBL fold metallo-hydrolase [Clostridia bacterium]|nr:MBL fold metallo-hydrolase [Clostridia bacterium]
MALKITFLGTCACDFSPRLKTDLRDKLDKDARRSSSMLINDTLLLDCGTHTINSLDILKIPYEQITDLLITHLHDDHFDVENIKKLAQGRHTPLRIWVREDATLPEIPNTQINKMTLFERYLISDNTYATGMMANHDESAFPQHFLIECEGKSVFYGCDGAWLLNKTYYHLHKRHLDVAVFDCTTGDYEGEWRIGEHNGIPMLRVMLPSLKSVEAITDKTKVYFSHLAPSLHKSHDETEKIAHTLGAFVAYDGLTIII